MKRMSLFCLTVLILCTCFTLTSAADEALIPDNLFAGLGAGDVDIAKLTGNILAIHSIADANAFLSTLSPVTLLLIVASSLLMALFGYRLLRLAIALSGFMAGWMAGSAAYSFAVRAEIIADPTSLPAYTPYVVYAVCGLIAALLIRRLLRSGIFIAASVGAYFFLNGIDLLPQLVDRLIPGDIEAKYLLVRLAIAAIVGTLALLITRPVLILATAGSGGMVAGIALTVLIGQTADPNVQMLCGLALTVIGATVQFKKRKG